MSVRVVRLKGNAKIYLDLNFISTYNIIYNFYNKYFIIISPNIAKFKKNLEH